MNIVKIDNGNTLYQLPEQCDIAVASRIHASLMDLIPGSVVEVDASRVERCGTPVAQVLLAASRELNEHGGRLVIQKEAPAIRKCFEDLGLVQEAQIWE